MHGAQTRIFHQKSLRFTEVKSHVLKAEEGGNIFNVVRAYFPLYTVKACLFSYRKGAC